MDKKLVYRQIKMLQSFAEAYRVFSCGVPMSVGVPLLWEVTKLYYDDSKNLRKSIDFVPSHSFGSIPVYHSCGLFDIQVSLCNENRIKQLISQCKSYGINL